MSAFLSGQVAIGATAKPVPIPPGSYNLVLSNVSAAAAICYLGPPGVGVGTGLAMAANATIVVPVAAGSTPGLNVIGTAGTLSWMQAA